MHLKNKLIEKIYEQLFVHKKLHAENFQNKNKVYFKGLVGDATLLYIAAYFKYVQPHCLIMVCDDDEQAQYTHNTLENLLPQFFVGYMPNSFYKNKIPKKHAGNMVLRTECLNAIAGKECCVIITTPESLAEKVIEKKTLEEKKIVVTQATKIKFYEIQTQLNHLGFLKTDFVYQAGQYAVRGGVIDIFSFANVLPYRIVLSGETVESIKIFNPENQLSEKNVLSFSISPQTNYAKQNEKVVSILEFISPDAILVADDFDEVGLKIEKFISQHSNFFSTPIIDEDENQGDRIQQNNFVEPQILQQQIESFNRIVFQATAQPYHQVEFKTQLQESFNREFKMMSHSLQEWQNKGFKIYISATSAKQFERIKSIAHQYQPSLSLHHLSLPLHEGFVDMDLKILCYSDHQIFQRYHKYQEKKTYTQDKILSIQNLYTLQTGDYLTHIDYGVGRFSGLQKITINGTTQESVRMIYKDNDVLFVNINSLYKLSKYSSKDGAQPTIHKIGSDAWAQIKQKTKKKIKELAFNLIHLYAKRKSNKGFQFAPDNFMQAELEASFIYEDTPDQQKANQEIKKDMEAESPMDRLICGDVGFGKTELAVRAAFKACCDSKQVAVLVPTTVLAFQHYQTFSERLHNFPVKVEFINRFKSNTEKKQIIEEIEQGKTNIIIGTHALLNKKIKFKDLGVLIIDEEQKFGVATKDGIKNIFSNVDCLTLSATPIPRTLQFSLMGARDMSIIQTPPANRQPVETVICSFDVEMIKEKILIEIERGGQIFFVHNRVQNLLELKALLQNLLPEVSIAHAHGQMEGKDLEDTLIDFIEKKYDILLSTNIIESGLDIKNVNTIFINNAHEFGLSDLHQLRGRVGRNNLKAYCYLMVNNQSMISDESKKKLRIIEQFSDLGSGFQIAMKDLDRRGAGDILGAEQSGFINEIGLDAYQKILNETMRELKQDEFKTLFIDSHSDIPFVEDCLIESDLSIFIPDEYVAQGNERLNFYTKINLAKTDEQLEKILYELKDRFGNIPQQVLDLITIMKCRRIAIQLGFEKIILKNKELKCFFISNQSSAYFESKIFNTILTYIKEVSNRAQIKQTPKQAFLVFQSVNTIDELFLLMQKIRS